MPLRRSLTAAVALALAACGGGSTTPAAPTVGPTPTGIAGIDPASLPECEYPDRISFPSWFPEDLPLPPGSYAAEKLTAVQGYRRSLLVVQRSLAEFQDFVLDRFPQEGWVVGRGDTEPGEVDLQFSRAPSVGAFRALDQFCRPGFVLVLMIFAPDREAIEAPPPISPNPGASPIG